MRLRSDERRIERGRGAIEQHEHLTRNMAADRFLGAAAPSEQARQPPQAGPERSDIGELDDLRADQCPICPGGELIGRASGQSEV